MKGNERRIGPHLGLGSGTVRPNAALIVPCLSDTALTASHLSISSSPRVLDFGELVFLATSVLDINYVSAPLEKRRGQGGT